MKQFVLLVSLICLFFACQSPARRAEALIDAADSLSGIAPDSALWLICSIDPDTLPTERLRARHALVHSMILDKCFIDLQDDSLILPAVEYFAEHGSNRERMQTYYYWARIAENAQQFTLSSERFLMAEHFLGDDTLDRYAALIARCLGDAYSLEYDFVPAVRHYRRSLDLFRALGEQVNMLRMYEYLATTYRMMGDYDGFDSIYAEVWPQAVDFDDKEMLLKLSNLKAGNDFFRGIDPRKIIDRLYATYALYHDGSVPENDYPFLALAYGELGNADSTRFFLKEIDAINFPFTLSQQTGLLYLHEQMLKLEGDMAQLINLKDSIVFMNDSLKYYQRTNSMERIEQRFRARMLEQSNRALLTRGRLFVLGGVVLAALLGTVIVRLVKRSRRIVQRKNTQIAAYLKELNDYRALKRNLLDRLDMQVSKEREVRELVESRFRQIRELATPYYQHPKTLRLAERVRALALSEEMLRDLESMVDLYHDGIVTLLRENGPELTEEDIRLAVLLIAGFTPQQISIVTDTAVNTVYVRKLRLRNKIAQSDTPFTERFIDEIFPSHES